jgi:hypothetical protein
VQPDFTLQRFLQIQRNVRRSIATSPDALQRLSIQRNSARFIATWCQVAPTRFNVALDAETLRCFWGKYRNAWKSMATWGELLQLLSIPLQRTRRRAVFSRSIAT